MYSADRYLNQVDNLIKEINKLNKTKDVLRSIEARVDMLTLCMTFVEKAQNEFLDYKKYSKDDPHDLIQIDFQISGYANRLHKASLKVIELLLKNVNNISQYGITIKKRTDLLLLNKKMLNISARWDIESFIGVYEFDMPESSKAFPKRKPLLQDVIFYANRMNATKLGITFEDGIMPSRIIFAVQPNSGKSFVVNVYSVLAILLHKIYYNTSGVLRMSNNGGNACGFSDQIKAMIENEKIIEIFPELKIYFTTAKPRVLEKSTSEEWKLQDLDPKIRASHFARGRDSAINSIRIFVLLAIDDLSDGFEQMNNDEAHKAMTTKYQIDMDSRKESEDIPEFIAGTMFNEFDVPNFLIKKLEDMGLLIDDPDNDNIRYTKDYSTVVIQIDCFDKQGNSIAPDLISTEKLKDKQESLKPYEFDLVYRQVRASREPRIFDWKNLDTYKDINSKYLSDSAIAVLDPTRKSGNDYFSMPCLRFNTKTNKYRLVDAIYTQKSLGRISDPTNTFLKRVVRFIIDNRITQFVLENNTSNTIGTLLEQELLKEGYNKCKIKELFSVKRKGQESKLQRILSQEATIVNNIEFPHKSILKPQTDLALFMEHFTRFDSKENIGKKSNPDDAPDTMAMFSNNFLYNKQNRYAEVVGISKSSIWGK